MIQSISDERKKRSQGTHLLPKPNTEPRGSGGAVSPGFTINLSGLKSRGFSYTAGSLNIALQKEPDARQIMYTSTPNGECLPGVRENCAALRNKHAVVVVVLSDPMRDANWNDASPPDEVMIVNHRVA